MRRTFLVFALLAAGCAHSGAKARPEAAAAKGNADSGGANVASAPHDSEPSKSYGWHLLETRCRSCHALPDPRTHTRERWVKGIDQMRRRFTLADADWDSLLALVPADTSQTGAAANRAAPSPATTR